MNDETLKQVRRERDHTAVLLLIALALAGAYCVSAPLRETLALAGTGHMWYSVSTSVAVVCIVYSVRLTIALHRADSLERLLAKRAMIGEPTLVMKWVYAATLAAFYGASLVSMEALLLIVALLLAEVVVFSFLARRRQA